MSNVKYSSRIERLKARRKGSSDQLHVAMESMKLPEYAGMEEYASLSGMHDLNESWESRGRDDSVIRYVLGAMQPVDASYTKVCFQTASRIQTQLTKKLELNLNFEVQGSVPLDIHIKRFSDVDLLIIDTQMLRYDKRGVGKYLPTDKDDKDVIIKLRDAARDALKAAFPKAHVDDNNAKSLKITGGSLPREVDVVPSIWLDTKEYQDTKEKKDRGIVIIDKNTRECIVNAPFLHIQLIKDKCEQCDGGLRKSIRLLKNLKADIKDEGLNIKLSSYDIASIMYHADVNKLRHGAYYELAILVETHRWLNYLANNRSIAMQLNVPNGTREIFEKNNSYDEFLKLTKVVNDLATEVLQEITGNSVDDYSNAKSHLLMEQMLN